MSSTVAVIGAGTIGRSFAYLFARSGCTVRVFDPREDLAEVVAGLQAAVTADASARGKVASQVGTVEESETVEAASFVQEPGPEDPDAKPELFARIAEAADAEAVLATSSSTIPASSIAEHLDAEAAARVLVGHPFNPPHLMPLIEVVPSPVTSSAAIEAAVKFYRSCGREPVVIRKEIRGFVGNRLQNALMREAISLVQNGVVSAPELDAVMRNSLGLRWSAVGQFEGMHFGGGEAGIRGFMDHIGPAFAAIEDLPVDVDPAAMEEVFEQVEQAYGQSPTAEAAAARDRVQRAVLDARGQDH